MDICSVCGAKLEEVLASEHPWTYIDHGYEERLKKKREYPLGIFVCYACLYEQKLWSVPGYALIREFTDDYDHRWGSEGMDEEPAYEIPSSDVAHLIQLHLVNTGIEPESITYTMTKALYNALNFGYDWRTHAHVQLNAIIRGGRAWVLRPKCKWYDDRKEYQQTVWANTFEEAVAAANGNRECNCRVLTKCPGGLKEA